MGSRRIQKSEHRYQNAEVTNRTIRVHPYYKRARSSFPRSCHSEERSDEESRLRPSQGEIPNFVRNDSRSGILTLGFCPLTFDLRVRRALCLSVVPLVSWCLCGKALLRCRNGYFCVRTRARIQSPITFSAVGEMVSSIFAYSLTPPVVAVWNRWFNPGNSFVR